jgi:cytochrome P450
LPVVTLDLDLYADPVLRDSREAFARIREAGPVVWLSRHRMYAMGRFDDVRAALRDDSVFRSGQGIAANRLTNRLGRDTTLISDDDTHTARRQVLRRALGADALKVIQGQVDDEARAIVERLAAAGEFDAARDFSSQLPLTIVAQLVGLRADGDQLLKWAAATFDAIGPLNRRGVRSGIVALSLFAYTQRLKAERVAPGSWAASVFQARDDGEITTREAKSLALDFVVPALDTTILASTHLLWALANSPDAWAQIRSDPSLIPAAVIENVRLASPIRGFTRSVASDHEVDGVQLPAGSRVLMLYGAANLDETQFPDPERFDITRTNKVQLGWGNGPHTCIGIHLSKLEMHALLGAMVPLVEDIQAGPPRRLLNNVLQGISQLPTRFTGSTT